MKESAPLQLQWGLQEEFLQVKGIWQLDKVTMRPQPSPETKAGSVSWQGREILVLPYLIMSCWRGTG